MQKGTLSSYRCSRETPQQKYSPRLGELKLPLDERQSCKLTDPNGDRAFNLDDSVTGSVTPPYPLKSRFVTSSNATSATVL